MKVSRVIHMRAPLHVRNYIGKREVATTIDTTRAAFLGGCTVVVNGDTADAHATVQIGWCRFNDNYARKKGVATAKAKEPDVVYLRDLAKELAHIEEQMLIQTSVFLRHHVEARSQCVHDWSHVVRHFLPTAPKEVA